HSAPALGVLRSRERAHQATRAGVQGDARRFYRPQPRRPFDLEAPGTGCTGVVRLHVDRLPRVAVDPRPEPAETRPRSHRGARRAGGARRSAGMGVVSAGEAGTSGEVGVARGASGPLKITENARSASGTYHPSGKLVFAKIVRASSSISLRAMA